MFSSAGSPVSQVPGSPVGHQLHYSVRADLQCSCSDRWVATQSPERQQIMLGVNINGKRKHDHAMERHTTCCVVPSC